jgi:hypothetical protein
VCYFIATHCSIAKLDGGRKENSVIYTLTWELLPKYIVVRVGDSEEKRKTRTPIMYAMVRFSGQKERMKKEKMLMISGLAS